MRVAFLPKMSFYSKRKSREYKSNDEPANSKIKMPNISNINFELVESNETTQPGDRLYAAKPVNSGEDVPEGSIPCFEPIGRPGIFQEIRRISDDNKRISDDNKRILDDNKRILDDNKRISDDNKRISDDNKRISDDNIRISDDNKRISDDNQSLRSDMYDLKTVNQQQMAINLNNDLVQLVYGLIHTRLLLFVRDKSFTRGKRVLYYDEIIAKVDPATRSRIQNDFTLNQLRRHLADGSDFRKIVETRNIDCHPKILNPNEIEAKIRILRDCDNLPLHYKGTRQICETVYDDIKILHRFNKMIEIFNDNNKDKNK